MMWVLLSTVLAAAPAPVDWDPRDHAACVAYYASRNPESDAKAAMEQEDDRLIWITIKDPAWGIQYPGSLRHPDGFYPWREPPPSRPEVFRQYSVVNVDFGWPYAEECENAQNLYAKMYNQFLESMLSLK